MNYWDDLKNRSIFLWRSLFGEEENEDREQPVYIDRAAAAQTAAAQKELLYTLRSELNDRETEGGDAAAAALYDAAIRLGRRQGRLCADCRMRKKNGRKAQAAMMPLRSRNTEPEAGARMTFPRRGRIYRARARSCC